MLFLACLALLAVERSPTAAANSDEYNEGLKIAVCQLYTRGYSTDQIAVELDKTFADFEVKVGQQVSVEDWAEFARQALSEGCS